MGRIIALLLILIISLPFSLQAKNRTFKVIAQDIEYAFYKKEKLVWKFKTSVFKERSDNVCEAIKIIIINLQKDLKIIADKGFYNKKEDKFLLIGKVHLFTQKFGEVFTDKLIYFPKQGLIITDKKVLVKKKGLIAKGKGLIYKIDTGDFQIKEKPRIKFSL